MRVGTCGGFMAILTTEDRAFFDENGYILVRDVVPKEACDRVVEATFAFLGMDPNSPEDWYRDPLPRGGMVEFYQHQTLWDTRQNPKLHQVFSEIYGTEKLWVTMDRVGLKPPRHPAHPEYDHKGFVHWDVDTNNPPKDLRVQGVLYLADTDANMGGFVCVPGFFNNREKLEAWRATQAPDRNPRQPDLTGLEVVPIPGKKGDLVIWNTLLAHGNGHNVSDRPRLAQYISMHPAQEENEEYRQKRVACWSERRPPEATFFPGDPRRIEEEQGTTAELTPLGRRLLGLDRW